MRVKEEKKNQAFSILSENEGFNFENVIKSMTGTGNEEFDLWLKVDRNGMEK